MVNSRWPSSSWTSLRLLPFITSHDAPKIGNLGLATGALKSRPDAAPRGVAPALAEHEAGRLRRLLTRRGRLQRGTRRSIERLERVVHCSIHRDLAPAPVLCLLEQQDAAGEVDVLPGQSEDLPFPHARVEGDRDNREQIWALTSPIFACDKKALDLVLAEKPEAPLWLL